MGISTYSDTHLYTERDSYVCAQTPTHEYLDNSQDGCTNKHAHDKHIHLQSPKQIPEIYPIMCT